MNTGFQTPDFNYGQNPGISGAWLDQKELVMRQDPDLYENATRERQETTTQCFQHLYHLICGANFLTGLRDPKPSNCHRTQVPPSTAKLPND